MKKLGDAIGSWDDAGHMGRGESAAEERKAAEGFSPCTPSSKSSVLINFNSRERGGASAPPIIPPHHRKNVQRLTTKIEKLRSPLITPFGLLSLLGFLIGLLLTGTNSSPLGIGA
jgi:hypothetical protein